MTSTEHPGGEGLKLHAIKPPNSIPHGLLIGRRTAARHAPTPSESGNTGREKSKESDLNQAPSLINELVLKAKVQGLIRCGTSGLMVLHSGCQWDTLKTTLLNSPCM